MIIQFFNKLNQASKNSWKGLKNAWQTQWAFRVELILLLLALPCAYFISENAVHYILLINSIFFILVAELINSAIETTVNRISLEYHELSGLAKDLASAAIFVSIINALITWIIISFLKIITRF